MSEDHYFSGAKVQMNDPQVLSLQCFKLRFLTEKEAGGHRDSHSFFPCIYNDKVNVEKIIHIIFFIINFASQCVYYTYRMALD